MIQAYIDDVHAFQQKQEAIDRADDAHAALRLRFVKGLPYVAELSRKPLTTSELDRLFA